MKKLIRIAILMTPGFLLLLSCNGRQFEKSVEEFSLPTIIAFRMNRNYTFSYLIKIARLFFPEIRVIIRHFGTYTRESL